MFVCTKIEPFFFSVCVLCVWHPSPLCFLRKKGSHHCFPSHARHHYCHSFVRSVLTSLTVEPFPHVAATVPTLLITTSKSSFLKSRIGNSFCLACVCACACEVHNFLFRWIRQSCRLRRNTLLPQQHFPGDIDMVIAKTVVLTMTSTKSMQFPMIRITKKKVIMVMIIIDIIQTQ